MPSIGEILQEARKKKGVSQEAAARALKIKLDRLRDLEESRYEHFAAHVYVRSFLRHYADYLGLDSTAIVQQFLDANPAPPIKPVFEITEDQRSRSPVQRHVPASSSASVSSPSFLLTTTGKTVILTALLILIVVGICMWWIINHMEPVQPPAQTPKPIPSPEAVIPYSPPPSPSLATNAPPFEVHRSP